MTPTYPVRCYRPGCGADAAFKVAAAWSDGVTRELKTYSLSCPDCLRDHLESARGKRAACRLLPGETLDEPGVYELIRGTRDQKLRRRADLE